MSILESFSYDQSIEIIILLEVWFPYRDEMMGGGGLEFPQLSLPPASDASGELVALALPEDKYFTSSTNCLRSISIRIYYLSPSVSIFIKRIQLQVSL